MAYIFGTDNVSRTLGEEIHPNRKKLEESVFKKIEGKTWVERLKEAETDEEVKRIVETESHRCFSDGQWDSAEGKATYKTWHTQEDEKVRDTHWYIDGLKVGVDEYFYTLDNDRALKPFEFTLAENNINCRCYLEYTKE